MAYYFSAKTSGGDIPLRDLYARSKTVYLPANLHASYSFRTNGKPASVLALGEKRLSQSLGSVSDYLEAEQTAITELNSELEGSSRLGEGTWGQRDAGHVFSSVHQRRRPQHYLTRVGDTVQPGSQDCAWFSHYADPITVQLFGTTLERHHLYLASPPEISQQDVIRQASEELWHTNPNVISGSTGQDLVDLAQLPHLLVHLKDLASAMDSLKSKWGRLDRDVQDAVDLLFKRGSSISSRQRTLKRLRSLPKRSLSRGSSAYLEWEFVLSPYIDDIRLLLRVLGQASGASIVTTRRSRISGESRVQGFNKGGTAWVYVPSWNSLGRSSAIWPSIPHTWFSLRYDISVHAKWSLRGASLDPFIQHAYDLNQQLGVIYPSLLWDLAPWTFLIDWFLHIGTSIDRVTYLNNGRYIPVYAWATIKGSSGLGWSSAPTPCRLEYIDECPWPGMPTTSWVTRFPVSLTGGIKPKWGSLPSSSRSLLAALGFSRLK